MEERKTKTIYGVPNWVISAACGFAIGISTPTEYFWAIGAPTCILVGLLISSIGTLPRKDR